MKLILVCETWQCWFSAQHARNERRHVFMRAVLECRLWFVFVSGAPKWNKPKLLVLKAQSAESAWYTEHELAQREIDLQVL